MFRAVGEAETGPMKKAEPTRVFIVDDSAYMRTRIAETLGCMERVRVVGEAASARSATAGILGLRPHSVLLDLNLGDGTGIEVLKSVRRQAPEIVFVVLTNQTEDPYRRACTAAGAEYFLDKTREFGKVREVIARIAERRAQEVSQ
jgi:DNA-binding NarL/FixJ family response regulator